MQEDRIPWSEHGSAASKGRTATNSNMQSVEPRASDPSPLALRSNEAAKALGISPRLLWQLSKEGRIPCVRIGSGKRKTVLYPVAELQAWLASEAAEAKGNDQ